MKPERRRNFIAGLALALALLGAVAWSDWRYAVRTRDAAESVEQAHQVQIELARLIVLTEDIETGAHGYVVTGEPDYLKPFEAGLKPATEQLRKLEQLIRDVEQQSNLSSLEPLIAERITTATTNVELRRNSGFEAARQEILTGKGRASMEKIRAQVARMDTREQALLEQRAAGVRRDTSVATLLSIAGTGLASVLLIAVFTLVLRESRLRQQAAQAAQAAVHASRQLTDVLAAATRDTKSLGDFKAALDEHAIVAITNPRGTITYVNDKFCAISKYAREELLGQDHRIINSGHHPKAFIRDLWQTISSGRVWKGEIKNRAKDGTFYWVATTIVPFLDEHGKPVRYVAIRADITERKQAEEHISHLNADLQVRAVQLAEANKELESFSYSVSHDLRAPLRHVHGYVEMLQRATDGQLSEKAQRYLKIVTDASGEMSQLIDDLLAFSHMGRTEMRESRVHLGVLVQDAIRGLEMATKGRNIVWQTAPLPPVVGDPSMLKQVLANLVGNAVKYTRMRDPAQIEVGCAGEEDGRVVLFVRDNGAGFDMQYVHKLFGVFQRLHRADEFEGTGIGLATVRRIVVRHGGRVWAEGAPNRGATFYFTLLRPPASA